MTGQKKRIRYTSFFLILAVLTIILIIWNISSGTVDLSVKEIIGILGGNRSEETAYQVIWSLRMPRILAVIILGGALSVSGFLLQTFFGNPIAGPFVLGISSSAKLIVAITMIYVLSHGGTTSSMLMIMAAFVGSMLSMGFVLVTSRAIGNMSMLVVCGVMVSYICSAITDFVVTFADDSNIVNLHNWSLGSFSGIDWNNVKIMFIVILISMIIAVIMAKPIGAYQLGEAYARNMGVNIKVFRIALILLSSILSATVTAFAGPISFVGIAVPHVVKRMFGTSKPLIIIPGCFVGGAVFCLLCDLIARNVFAPTELSISSVTAVFGAPIVIYMMINRKSARG